MLRPMRNKQSCGRRLTTEICITLERLRDPGYIIVTDEIMIDVRMQDSMVEAPFVVIGTTSDRVGPSEKISRTEDQVQVVELGIEAPKDGDTTQT